MYTINYHHLHPKEYENTYAHTHTYKHTHALYARFEKGSYKSLNFLKKYCAVKIG